MGNEVRICRRCQSPVVNLGGEAGPHYTICSCAPKDPLLEGKCIFCSELSTDGPYLGFKDNPKLAKPVSQINFCHERCYHLHILEAEDKLQKRFKDAPADLVAKQALGIFTQLADRVCRGDKIPFYRNQIIKHQNQ